MITYKKLLILRLSNLTEWKNEAEMIIPEEMRGDFNDAETCEFLGDGKCILRRYWENGQTRWKKEYQNGKSHRLSLGWYKNGQQWWKTEWQNGKLHGVALGWWENGHTRWKIEYQNGLKHGVALGWYKNGQQWWKTEYKNGKLIKDHI